MYVNTKTYANKYNIPAQQINYLIKTNKIKSAIKKGKTFFIDDEEDFKNNDNFIVKEFPYITLQEYADKYNLSKMQVDTLLKKGLIKDIKIGNLVLIDKDTPKHTLSINNSKKCTDHLGNEYKSISEMCRAYNVNYKNYNESLKNNKYKFDDEIKLIKYCLTGEK